jgi:hypothetical protein
MVMTTKELQEQLTAATVALAAHDETFQAWRRSAARVALNPAWPVPIELNVVSLGWTIVLQCIVHAYNASDVLEPEPLVPWADLPMTDFGFSQTVPDIYAPDASDCDAARLRHVLERVREAAMHEFDEFLLVDGRVAAPPHETLRPAVVPMLSVKNAEISTWCSAIARISLHPAFRMQVDLVLEENPQGCTTISCAVRHSDPGLAATVRCTASARDNAGHMQQLLVLVRHTARRLLDGCLIVDGIPRGAGYADFIGVTANNLSRKEAP